MGLIDRYSQLTHVFAELIHAGFMDEAALAGLAEAKRANIRHTLSFLTRHGSSTWDALKCSNVATILACGG